MQVFPCRLLPPKLPHDQGQTWTPALHSTVDPKVRWVRKRLAKQAQFLCPESPVSWVTPCLLGRKVQMGVERGQKGYPTGHSSTWKKTPGLGITISLNKSNVSNCQVSTLWWIISAWKCWSSCAFWKHVLSLCFMTSTMLASELQNT